MGRFERTVFTIILGFLVIILIIMIVQETNAEEENEIYRVTVIMDRKEDSFWKNFRKGIDSAAVKFNVDVQFVSLLDGASPNLQAYFLNRQIGNKADAVIVSVSNSDSLIDWESEISSHVPIITIGKELPSKSVDVRISGDDYNMGKTLADVISADGIRDCAIYVAENGGNSQEMRLEGLKNGLTENEVEFNMEIISDNSLSKLHGDHVVAALDASDMLQIIDRADKECKIYGIGFSNLILSQLEDGNVYGLVVQSDYAAGYLCIKSAVNIINGIKQADEIQLQYYKVNKDNMYEKPLEQILFPIS